MLLLITFVAFPERSDSLLEGHTHKLNIEASGSLGLYYGDNKCVQTYPNQTLISDRKLDWCSNIAKSSTDLPWIQYYFPQKAMKIKGYSIRNGCCYYACCCDAETGKVIDYRCCCELYSFSLQGSNDNKTWTTIHKVVGDQEYYYYCQYKTYEFDPVGPFNFLRIYMDQERPGCPKCMQLNQIEFYGQLLDSAFSFGSYESDDEPDESISIIGKVKRE